MVQVIALNNAGNVNKFINSLIKQHTQHWSLCLRWSKHCSHPMGAGRVYPDCSWYESKKVLFGRTGLEFINIYINI